MTAPEPTAEHIDAVTFAIDPYEYGVSARSAARDILTSTDPAVHAALAASLPAEVMLAALVDRGALTEDRERLVRECGCMNYDEPAACCNEFSPPHWERRLVTRWEVVP